MDAGAQGFHPLDVDQNLRSMRNHMFSLQSSLPVLDGSLHMHHGTSHQRNYASEPNSDSAGSVMSTRNIADPYGHSQLYFPPSAENMALAHHRYSGLSDVSLSGSRKHVLTGVVRTRRRKAGISDEERVCIVCGEPASGYNFDRLTCESCKAFFRRNALKPRDKIKACSRGGGCTVEGNQRKHCPSCRLEKCLAVGMKRELILPPEKLEQRAKPRRRKHHSPQDSNASPQHLLTGPSSVGSGNTATYPSYLPSPLTTSTHQQQQAQLQTGHLNFVGGVNAPPPHLLTSLDFPPYTMAGEVDNSMTVNTFSPAVDVKDPIFHPSVIPKTLGIEKQSERFLHHGRITVNPKSSIPIGLAHPTQGGYKTRSAMGLVRCRRVRGRTFCQHQRCLILARRRRRRLQSMTTLYAQTDPDRFANISSPDPHLLNCLHDCIRRIREPFTPEEQLETGVAVTLEQEYNRMDACIRRIIRVVKLLPYFGEVGKPAQLSLLRTNIYGLIVLYSSFFFERDIRKLRYPVLQSDGQLTTVTVSMLDEVVAPNSTSTDSDETLFDADPKPTQPNYLRPCSRSRPRQANYAISLREEFELYKANTLSAFDHLDQLIGSDDVLRMCVLAIKLFTDDSLSEESRTPVRNARQAYLVFLWTYISWLTGPKRLRSATELYARLLIAFIDLRTLEIRMTEFAKLLSLDGLSPLMREVCSQRTVFGSA